MIEIFFNVLLQPVKTTKVLIDLQQAWPDIEGELLGLLDSAIIPT